ncbi:hypothetical protein NSQ45_02275 [Caldifermentibacillus hisashii]|uniref:hypothetical protein n=1 Tax=Bacillaceae TaxID=186817 RepID=UPI001F2A4C64|nr:MULTISPECIES: hypothetical protein [Bacillaceae]
MGSIRASAENTHTVENGVRALFSQAYEVNIGNGQVTKATGNVNLKNIDEFIEGTKNFDDVVDDFARLYSEKVQTNKTWSWNKSFHGGEY